MDWLERLRIEGNPLIDVDTATFVWIGESAPALRGDFNQWAGDPADLVRLQEVAPGIWTHTITLPRDAYIEYVFCTPENYREPEANIRDPYNHQRVWNGFDNYNHSFLMPAARHTSFTRVRANVPRGTLTKHTLINKWVFPEGQRDLWLYAPPGISAPVPLLVVWDGQDYLKRGKIVAIVDNLIARGHIQPIALALVASSKRARYIEYQAGEPALELLTSFVLPLARTELNLLDPGAYGVLGASMGGLMAFYAALRLPEIFSKVITQAGAFVYRPLHTQDVWIHTLLEHLPTQPLQIWQDVGTLDWLLASNRDMHRRFLAKGYTVTYREYNAAHNFVAWRDVLPDALINLFSIT